MKTPNINLWSNYYCVHVKITLCDAKEVEVQIGRLGKVWLEDRHEQLPAFKSACDIRH